VRRAGRTVNGWILAADVVPATGQLLRFLARWAVTESAGLDSRLLVRSAAMATPIIRQSQPGLSVLSLVISVAAIALAIDARTTSNVGEPVKLRPQVHAVGASLVPVFPDERAAARSRVALLIECYRTAGRYPC
jgi:hypothetical protein